MAFLPKYGLTGPHSGFQKHICKLEIHNPQISLKKFDTPFKMQPEKTTTSPPASENWIRLGFSLLKVSDSHLSSLRWVNSRARIISSCHLEDACSQQLFNVTYKTSQIRLLVDQSRLQLDQFREVDQFRLHVLWLCAFSLTMAITFCISLHLLWEMMASLNPAVIFKLRQDLQQFLSIPDSGVAGLLASLSYWALWLPLTQNMVRLYNIQLGHLRNVSTCLCSAVC